MSFMPKSVPSSRLAVTAAHLDLAKHCLLFRDVSAETMAQLPDICSVLALSQGDVLMSLGQSNDRLYLILDGQLGIQTSDTEHHHHITLQAGECVGELSLIDGQAVSAMVSAVSETLLLEIEQKSLWQLIETCHSIARNLLHILSGRLRDNNKAVNEALEQRSYFEKAAYLDSLTGVNNRRWLDKAFPRELSRCRQNKEQLSLAFLDIDHFKQFNDCYGHLAGDIALRAVAQALANSLRPTDLLARYGGEEFAIVFPCSGGVDTLLVAERVRRAVSALKLVNYDGSDLPCVSLSVGLTTLRETDNLEMLIARADKALYEAKEAGRDQVVVA